MPHLSAIAARKAAKAENAKHESKSIFSPETTEGNLSTSFHTEKPPELPLLGHKTSHPHVTPSRKRKGKGKDSDYPRKKKSRVLNHMDVGFTRYYEGLQPIEEFEDFSEGEEQLKPGSVSFAASTSDSHGVEYTMANEDKEPSRTYSPSRPLLDSSDEEGETQFEIQTHASAESNVISPSPTPASNLFHPQQGVNTFLVTPDELETFRLGQETTGVPGTMLLLHANESIPFIGTTCLMVLKGSIFVLGSPIHPSPKVHRVFSSRCSLLADITASEPSPHGDIASPMISKIPARLRKHVDNVDVALIIRPLRNGITGLGKIFRTLKDAFELSLDEIESEKSDAIAVKGFYPIDPQRHPRSYLQSFSLSESWLKTLQHVLSRFSMADTNTDSAGFVAIIKGPKKCGKSTFARILLNWLCSRFKRVAFIESDLGQSEFTPGGMVSLHIMSSPVLGPPYTHITKGYRAHFVGNTTPRSNPSLYLACIEDLMQVYCKEIKHAFWEAAQDDPLSSADTRSDDFVPLVVNTQGWHKGLGGDLLRRIEAIVAPTDIFNLDPEVVAMPEDRAVCSPNSRLHSISAIPSSTLSSYYTATDYRSMSILSYFYSQTSHDSHKELAWFTDIPLCALSPWELSCNEVLSQIVLLGPGYEDVVAGELERVINGSIVALVSEEDSIVTNRGQAEDKWPYTQGASPPSPTTSHCIGLAFVRAVDANCHALHLLTPVNPAELAQCSVLVKGELEMPIWGFLDFRDSEGVGGVRWGKVPYLEKSGGEGFIIGSARRKIRRNLMRRNQVNQ